MTTSLEVEKLRSYLHFLLNDSSESELRSMAFEVQGQKRFKILPRIVITPFGRWIPIIFEQSDLGPYVQVPFLSKESEKLIEGKYPHGTFLTDSQGNRYLEHAIQNESKTITKIYSVSPSNVLKLLLSLPFGIYPILFNKGVLFFSRHSQDGVQLEAWGKKSPGGKYELIQKIAYDLNGQGYFEKLDDSKIIFINGGDGNYKILTLLPNSDFLIKSGRQLMQVPSTFIPNVIPSITPLTNSEIVLFYNGIITIFELRALRLMKIQEFTIDSYIGGPESGKRGFVRKVSSDSFTVNVEINRNDYQVNLYRRNEKGKYRLFQILHNNKNNYSTIVVLKPSKTEIKKWAQLLPLEALPLDLKIEMVEFCVSS